MLYPKPQIYHPLNAIFIHVPKTAGTSIEKQLAERCGIEVGGHTTALAFRRAFAQEFATYFKFSVVRDPLDRFVSAFRYLRTEPVHPAHANEIIHRLDSIDAFIASVRRDPAGMKSIVHLMPQHQFVCDASGIVLVDRLYRFEALEDAWKDISRRLNLGALPLPKMNASLLPMSDALRSENIRAFVREKYADDYRILKY